jgi:CelD/BcsL family acetyltransferase involved in cellulose biosynthesis
MIVEVRCPRDLSDDDIDSLARIQSANPIFRSPFLHPQFARCVAQVLPATEMALLTAHGETIGYFSYERSQKTTGVPCGRQLSDYQGIVLRSDYSCSVSAVLRACRLQRFNYDHLLYEQSAYFSGHRHEVQSPLIRLSDGMESFWGHLRSSGSSLRSEFQRKWRQLESHSGTLEVVHVEDDQDALSILLGWKAEQYRATGVENLFALGWPQCIVEALLRQPHGKFRATLTILLAGAGPVAGILGMQCENVWHWWFPAYSPEHARFSPGMLLFVKMLEELSRAGIVEIDLGKGESSFKQRFANAATFVVEGSHVRPLMVARTWVMRHLRSFVNLGPKCEQ